MSGWLQFLFPKRHDPLCEWCHKPVYRDGGPGEPAHVCEPMMAWRRIKQNAAEWYLGGIYDDPAEALRIATESEEASQARSRLFAAETEKREAELKEASRPHFPPTPHPWPPPPPKASA